MRNKKESAFTLGNFVERSLVKNKRTASTRIQEINSFCDEMEAKPIFHKFPGNKWGLNPLFDNGTQ